MTLTGATLFTGFGGADIGMQNAGITPLWGIEYDPDIAEVAQDNGIPVTVANLLSCDPSEFPPVDVLHASPPCPNFSIAKTGAQETGLDKDLACKVAGFIATLMPRVFTLENVWAYRHSESWGIIHNALRRLGYAVDVSHVNFANLGVPQTRKRMIVRTIRGAHYIPRIKYTHQQSPPPMFGLNRWVGWYQAIEDLLPTFESAEFAPWQIARLPKELTQSFLMGAGGNTNFGEAKPGKGCLAMNMSAHTVTAGNGSYPRAFIVDGAGNDNCTSVTWRDGNEPVYTMTASMYKRPTRGSVQGRVVKLSVRALARLQSFPDSYQFPESNKLACKGIGNACPPLGMQKIFEQLRTIQSSCIITELR